MFHHFFSTFNAEILLSEVLSTVKTLYNHKAPNRDNVFCEMIKHGGLKCYEIMTKLFNTCLKQHKFEKYFKTSVILPLFKKR